MFIIPSTWTELKTYTKTKSRVFTKRPPLQCAKCKKVALYIVGKIGYCKEHKVEAVTAREHAGRMFEKKQLDRERLNKVFDAKDKKNRTLKRVKKRNR